MATKRKRRTQLPEPTRGTITCAGPITTEARGEVVRHLTKGDLALARAADRAGRTPCGQDLSALIYGHPYDGQEFTVTCPKCGTVSTHRNVPEDATPRKAASKRRRR